jgi:uncharacterized protein (TIGR02599 family)
MPSMWQIRATDRSSGFPDRRRTAGGFSLLEVLVSCAILALLVVILASTLTHTSTIFRQMGAKVDAFQEARFAFDLLVRELSQATLNTFWRQDNLDYPSRYVRSSDLHFLVLHSGQNNAPGVQDSGHGVFFQAPLGHTATPDFYGLDTALNAVGFFVDFGPLPQPAFANTPPRHRFQLKRFLNPTEELKVFADRENADDRAWLTSSNSQVFPVAANIIALVLWPRRGELDSGGPLTADFTYNSRSDGDPQPATAHQLPPAVEVVMVAIDEASANLIENGSAIPSAISEAQKDLFKKSDSDQITKDLATLEKKLVEARVNYRIFRTVVPLRESKWSDQ